MPPSEQGSDAKRWHIQNRSFYFVVIISDKRFCNFVSSLSRNCCSRIVNTHCSDPVSMSNARQDNEYSGFEGANNLEVNRPDDTKRLLYSCQKCLASFTGARKKFVDCGMILIIFRDIKIGHSVLIRMTTHLHGHRYPHRLGYTPLLTEWVTCRLLNCRSFLLTIFDIPLTPAKRIWLIAPHFQSLGCRKSSSRKERDRDMITTWGGIPN